MITTINEFKKYLINESNNTENLTKEEENVLNDILTDLETTNESINFNSILDKVKNYTKKGLMTAAVLASLLANPVLSQTQKSEIQNITKTEMTTVNSNSNILKSGGYELGLALIKAYNNNVKGAKEWSGKHNHTSLVSNIESIIKTNKSFDDMPDYVKRDIKDFGNLYKNNTEALNFLNTFNK